jgi:hypothetical protein
MRNSSCSFRHELTLAVKTANFIRSAKSSVAIPLVLRSVAGGMKYVEMVMLRARTAALIAMILGAALSRLIPHPPNMASVTAVALFGGAYFSDRRLAFLVPLTALFLSDLVLGFYDHMEIVYASFALIVCIGLWLQKNRSALHIAGAALASSVLFFLLTNLGVWASGSLYPMTLDGLIACYVAAIPFFRNTLQGDALYTVLLFGSFWFLERRFSMLREPSIRSAMRLA